MNFMLINYYRDHGYAMGHKVGFYSGVFGGQKKEVLPSGVTFRESARNTGVWRAGSATSSSTSGSSSSRAR
jgi:hypothetical protein